MTADRLRTESAPVVTLREITDRDRAEVEALAVTPEQNHYVAGVVESLAEAAQFPDAKPWYRAVYADREPVGFVMISDGITVSDPDYLGPYYLWRLIVDTRFQGHGYGTKALDLVVAYLRTRPDAHVLLTSHVVGPASPRGFYLRYGFRPTDLVHNGEPVLEYGIDPATRRPA